MSARLSIAIFTLAAIACGAPLREVNGTGSARGPLAGALGSANGSTAITHVTLIDGTGATPREDVTILIEGGRIRETYASLSRPVPSGFTEIDGRGRYVIPGLIDSHVHTATSLDRPASMNAGILRNALLWGVTSARDMGGRTETLRPLRATAALDSVASPRLYLSAIMAGPGGWFDGPRGVFMAGQDTPGSSALVRKVGPETDVPRAIADAKAAGATAIKIYNTVPPALIRQLVDEAHRQGLRAWSHLAVSGHPSEVINAGVDVVSHASMFIAEFLPNLPAGTPVDEMRAVRHRVVLSTPLDTAPLTNMLTEMRRRGTALDATLFIMAPRAGGLVAVSDRGAALFHFAVGMVRRANMAGVTILAGTDHMGGVAPNIHAELQLLVDSAGLSPMQALQAATINGARAVGAQDSLGTVTAGKLADLVILRADPLVDIANTQTVDAVMKGGRLYSPSGPMPAVPLARAPRRALTAEKPTPSQH